MKLRYCFILFTWFFCFAVKAQTPNDELWPNDFNKKYLEHLIKIKVDSVRAVYDLPALANDSILYVAANYHGNYLRKTGRFSHYEIDVPTMKSPQQRIDSFGAVNVLAGENLVKSYIQKPVRTKSGATRINRTYQQIAWALVDAWVHSPGHFANIITPQYDITGVAVAMDSASGLVIAVQKFGNVLFKYSFEENKEFFSYSDYHSPEPINSFSQVDSNLLTWKHAFNTYPIEWTDDALKAAEIIENRKYQIKTFHQGSKVGINTWSTDMLYNFLNENRKNGLAFEFVPFEPYDCGNPAYYVDPSRRNGQSIYTGEISEPIYRKELLNGFKKNRYDWFWRAYKSSDRDYFKKTLAKPPENSIYYEQNILFYHRKQLIRVIHLTDYCGEGSLLFNLEPLNEGFIRYRPSIDVFIPPFIEKAIAFEIPFEQGKYEFTGESANPLLDSIRLRFTKIDSLKIHAFSSLEGDSAMNAKLQQKRSENIRDLIVSGFPEKDIPFQIELSENWEKLDEQINDSIGYEHWANLDKNELRDSINTSPDRFEPILKDQRKAHIQIHGTLKTNRQDSIQFLAEKYNSLKEIEPNFAKEVDDSLAVYFSFHAALVNYKKAEMLELPENLALYPKLDQTLFWMQLVDSVQNWNELKTQEEVKAGLSRVWSREPSAINYYNYLIYQLKLDPDSVRLDYKKLVQVAENQIGFSSNGVGVSQSRFDSVLYLLHIKSAEQLWKVEDFEYTKNIDFIFNYYQNNTEIVRNEEEAVNLAGFFLRFENQPYAFQVLKPWAVSTHLEALKLFAKINYHHVEEHPASGYYDWLIEIRDYLQKEEWCGLFIGPCNIPFQIFDYEPLRIKYCQECDDYKNYVEQLYEKNQLENSTK